MLCSNGDRIPCQRHARCQPAAPFPQSNRDQPGSDGQNTGGQRFGANGERPIPSFMMPLFACNFLG